MVILGLGTLVLVQYFALAWIAPRYAVHAIRNAVGEDIRIGSARMQFPFTLELSDVRWEGQWPKAGLLAEQMIIKPAWVSWKSKTVLLRSMEVKGGWLHLSRDSDGVVHWPSLEFTGDPEPPGTGFASHWTVTVASLLINDGTLSYYDEHLRRPFSGAIEHMSLVAGSVSWPPVPSRVTLAIRGILLGHNGHSAPLYCSGWFDSTKQDVDISCQLEPLTLAAFEPYYNQGRITARMYDATLKATSQWSVRNNVLDARIQLTIDNLDEADLSMRGTTLLDIQEIAQGEPPTLTGQIKVSGLLNDPEQWHLELIPGNEMVQRLLKPLVDRGREAIRLRLGGERIAVGISAATKAEMSEIEEANKQVEKTLELLTEELPQEVEDLMEMEAKVKKEAEKVAEAEAKTIEKTEESEKNTASDSSETEAPETDEAVKAAVIGAESRDTEAESAPE